MKAVDTNLLELLRASTQFVVPIYQRVYSWDETECTRLWEDILNAGRNTNGAHFTGSIVYVKSEEENVTAVEPNLIIDGQQRVTTVMLILAALSKHLESLPVERQEPVEGFSPKKIRGRFLSNSDEDGDRFFKLILSKSDEEALKAVVTDAPLPDNITKVTVNFRFFCELLADSELDLQQLCLGLKKLVVVDVSLKRGVDDPQLVFETMNSTGKRLTQADLIRNFVLMDLDPRSQRRLYEQYWFPMEQKFAGPDRNRFDEFVRHWLTFKTGGRLRKDDIYEEFKAYAAAQQLGGSGRESLVVELHQFAGWFANMAFGMEPNAALNMQFRELEQIRATVTYPFLLRAYASFGEGSLSAVSFGHLLTMITSYILRRAACGIPTNSLQATFISLAASVDPTDYEGSTAARLLLGTGSQRFPTDDEFEDALVNGDFYHFKRAPYFFRKLENLGRKELVPTSDYTIEHILPQNANLSTEWRSALGPEWKTLHEKYLHTLGNLTLTGYNPEYSDHPFHKKRDMEGGFRHSPLRLNAGLAELDTWNEDEILNRGRRLAKDAVRVWPRPQLSDDQLEKYQARFRDKSRFDWTGVHTILDRIEPGHWTGYYYLAEAVGTSAQAAANHLATCRRCAAPYRVLTWDGRVAQGFSWSDPDDNRDPHDVLAAEGVRFHAGVADERQKLTVQDLMELLEDAE